MSQIKCYFVTSHTAHGFVNFLETNIEGLQIYLIKHPSLTLKTHIFKHLMNVYKEQDESIEVLVSGHSKKYIDGIIVRSHDVAIVGDHLLDKHESYDYEFVLKELNNSDQFNEKQLAIDRLLKKAHQYIYESLQAHKALEEDYIAVMDFERSNERIEQVKRHLFETNEIIVKDEPTIFKRLFGSNTVHGNYHVVAKLLPLVDQRILLKGGPGTGKSFFMKEIVKASLTKGYSVEQYMCSFDPSSIDMVTIPKLNVSILDSTGSHAFSPYTEEDVVIDLFEVAGLADVEIIHQDKFNNIKNVQQKTRQQANTLLKEAGIKLEQLEKELMADVREDDIDRHVSTLLNTLH